MTVRASTNKNAELIRLHVEPFDCVADVATEACRIACQQDRRVGFTFNGVACQAGPMDEPGAVVDRSAITT